MNSGVFINYRGADTGAYGSLLYLELAHRFGSELVFLDSESIDAGTDYVEELPSRVRRCRVLLAVIGSGWLTAAGVDGRRRIDDPWDWIRRELAEAIAAGVMVIPVLTDGAVMPRRADLPADIAALGDRQYVPLRHREATADLDRICAELTKRDPALDAAARRRSRVPCQLPADVSAFTGRAAELAELDRHLKDLVDLTDVDLTDQEQAGRPGRGGEASTAIVISAVSGTAEVGKTALALRWANQVRDRFPDGQLYVNLRGYDLDQAMSPTQALAHFLTGLGVSGQDMPLDLNDRAARYRTEVDGRRLLVVLDNASSVEQVRPLLPGAASVMVLVTSRDSLAGLVAMHGARRIDLDLLPLPDAVTLLRTLIGPRIDAEPRAAQILAEQCVRLPLALRVAAELAVSRPAARLADLVAELADLQLRLELLDAGGDPRAAVHAVFSWSYDHLPAETADAFRPLSLHPGPDIDAYAAAALTNTSLHHARTRLGQLARAHLVQPTTDSRSSMHDLLRGYAIRRSDAEDTDDQRRAALNRLFDYYLATAAAAMDTLHPAEVRTRPRILPAATPAPALADSEAARTWLDAERPTLVAVAASTAERGWPAHTVQLAATLYRYLAGGHATDALTIHGHARRAAERTGDAVGQAQALVGLGTAYFRLGRYEEAADHYAQAHTRYQRAGDRDGEARALTNLGTVHDRQGRYEPAVNHHRQALALHQQTGDQHGEAHALNNLGIVEWRLGWYQLATRHYEQALAMHRQLGDRTGEGYALIGLGLVGQREGRHKSAADQHQQAMQRFEQIGNRTGQADALDSLGVVHTSLGRPDQAAEYHRQALALARDAGDRNLEAWALNGLGEAAHLADRPAEAHDWHATALSIACDIGSRGQQARASAGLGRVHATLGKPALARDHYRCALDLYTKLGQPEADDIRARLTTLEDA
jgi:tetratricopeptide (TPR) repeat protein